MNKPQNKKTTHDPHYHLTFRDDKDAKTWVTIGDDETKITLNYIDAYRLTKDLMKHFQLFR